MEQEQETLPAIIATGSTALSIGSLREVLANLPERLDDQQLALCDRIAASPVPPFEPASDEHFAKCLKVLSRSLPRRKADEQDGDLWLKTYRRMLNNLPAEQLNFIAAECMRRLDWFPTVKQMLDIGKEWRGVEQAERIPAIAASRSERERFARLQEIRRRLKDEVVEQAWIDALLPGQRVTLETEGLLRLDTETGGYSQPPAQIERIRKWQEFQAAQGA